MITAEMIKSHCGTGKVVRMVLYTGTQGLPAVNGKTYACACLTAMVRPPHGYSRRRLVRSVIQLGPSEITLFSSGNKPVLRVVSADVNEDLFPLVFDAGAFRTDGGVVPVAWVDDIHSHNGCRIQALPCSSKVSVLGTLWKTPRGVYLRGFNFSGLMGQSVAGEPIVSPASMEKVLQQFR